MFTLIVIAMHEEIATFLANSGFQEVELAPNFFTLFIKKKILIIITGIGLVNISSAVVFSCAKFNINRIINVGSCGTFSKTFKIGDITLVQEFRYADVDLTIFDYELGQLPEEVTYFISDAQLNQKIKNIFLQNNNENYKLVDVNSLASDRFIASEKNIASAWSQKLDFKKVIFDMESTAIAHVCLKLKKPFASIKIITDNFSIKSNPMQRQFKINLEKVALKINYVLITLMKYLTEEQITL